MSEQNPFATCAGYITSRVNPLTNVHAVVYMASEQGIDGGPYVTVCEKHHQMISATSILGARMNMWQPCEWCSDCRTLAEKHGSAVRNC